MARCSPETIGHVARLLRGAGAAVQGFTRGSEIDELSEQVTLPLGPSAGRRLLPPPLPRPLSCNV